MEKPPEEAPNPLTDSSSSSALKGSNVHSIVGMSLEAPARLGSSASGDRNLWRTRRKLTKQRSWSNESSREEAWRKKKDQFVVEEGRGIHGSSSTNASDRSCWPVHGVKSRPRARNLTDEDLDELRGFIDLGFRFSYEEEHHELCNTLPALDLYYAVNREYIGSKFKSLSFSSSSSSSPPSSSPASATDRSSCGSPMSPLCDTWRIASPGDNPQHVKTRLRHWAQAVACSVRQCC